MSPRSWLWWGVAVVLTHAHLVFARPSGGIGCAGIGLYQVVAAELWSIADWVPLVWYSGIPAVGLVVVTCWLWEPWAARQIVRWLAASLLLFFGLEQFGFLVDLFLSPGCLDTWGWSAFTRLDLFPPLAALCMIAAVRAPGRRLLNARRLTLLTVVGVLALVPTADQGSGRITPDREGAGDERDRVKEVAYVSPDGAIVVHDPLAGPSGLPNLAIAGPGRYRVRTHYRIAHDDGVGHLLVIVFPERR
ncbi:hypothetical protein AB0K48_17520 [Nonomuraea sp. NPDC055795]